MQMWKGISAYVSSCLVSCLLSCVLAVIMSGQNSDHSIAVRKYLPLFSWRNGLQAFYKTPELSFKWNVPSSFIYKQMEG